MQRATTSQWDHLRRALSSLTDAPLPDGNEPRPATFDRAGLFCREGDTWALHKQQSFWRLGSQGTSARRVMTMSCESLDVTHRTVSDRILAGASQALALHMKAIRLGPAGRSSPEAAKRCAKRRA